MKRFDVVGVGANSVDVVCVLPGYPRPEGPSKLPILQHRLSPGGQVATALSTCAAMGLRTAYVGTFGTDAHARLIREALTRRGVDLTHAVEREGSNPFAVILLEEGRGERLVLWRREPGRGLGPDDVPVDLIRSARLVHVDDVDEDASIRAARLARDAGLFVTSDLERVTDRTMELVQAVTVPVFAEGVPETLTGESDAERALRTLRRTHTGLLCVTLGERGAMLLDGDRLHHAAAVRVPVVDTTGAGDVFRGGLITALLRGDAPEHALRFAVAAAAASCARMGAMDSVPTLDEAAALERGE